ncbi:MAG: hypothetical protein ACI9N1_001136 [Flavobacteriales bacterium]|jgi:hypothetical protein
MPFREVPANFADNRRKQISKYQRNTWNKKKN